MNFQIDAAALATSPVEQRPAPSGAATETVELLRQILEVQREQLTYQRTAAAAHDMTARWRAFLTRWQQDFPDLADNCRKSLPQLERCYGQLLRDLTDRLTEEEQGLDNEFALQEFLDRFGMRLAQLGTILNLVGPLADAANTSQGESA